MANPEAMALLKIARRDLTAAALLQDPAADEANWGFQIQQVVEKALKAWLFSLGDDPPLIHNLTALFERIRDRGGRVEPFLPMEAFTVFAVQFRYDAEPAWPTALTSSLLWRLCWKCCPSPPVTPASIR